MRVVAVRRSDEGNRREHLLDAAKDVFFEQGYQKASMREIARRSGMTQAAIYYHFADKEDLLFTLIDRFSERFVANLVTTVAQPAEPPDKLARIISSHLDVLLSSREELKILVTEKHNLSEMRLRLIRSKEKTALMVYRACLEEMRKAGHLHDIDPTAAAFSIIGAINSMYHWYKEGGKVTFEVVRQSILNMVLSGICARAPAGHGGS